MQMWRIYGSDPEFFKVTSLFFYCAPLLLPQFEKLTALTVIVQIKYICNDETPERSVGLKKQISQMSFFRCQVIAVDRLLTGRQRNIQTGLYLNALGSHNTFDHVPNRHLQSLVNLCPICYPTIVPSATCQTSPIVQLRCLGWQKINLISSLKTTQML